MSEFVLQKVIVRGFRGFTTAQEIEFNKPVTLLFGPNRTGKSSVLNAVEWCIFGPEVAAIKYGDIRERDGWEVRNLISPECRVRCEFKSPTAGHLFVQRTYKSAKTTQFMFEASGKARSSDEHAFRALLNISPEDYLSSVHLHPEVIRSLMVQKPQARKEAIDRLLGLSELRDMESAVMSMKTNRWSDILRNQIDNLDGRLKTAMDEKSKTIHAESKELLDSGFQATELNVNGACAYASRLVKGIRRFAEDYKIKTSPISVPQEIQSLRLFVNSIRPKIASLRDQNPVLAGQGQALTKKNILEGLQERYAHQLKQFSMAESAVKTYPEKRPIPEIDSQLERIASRSAEVDSQMRQISKNATLLKEAWQFFGDLEATGTAPCPLCGVTSKAVSEWRKHLIEEINRCKVQPLKDESDVLFKESAALQNAKKEINARLARMADEQRRLEQVRSNAAAALGRPLNPADDIRAVLDAEIAAVNHSLETLQQQVIAVNTAISSFENSAHNLDRLLRISRTQTEIEQIEALHDNPAYQEMFRVQAECDRYAEDVELLVDAIRAAVSSEAQVRLDVAQSTISSNFRKLTNRPDYPDLRVSVSTDGYNIELENAEEKRKAVPILNHGDMNCAALSIFLALSSSSQISHHLGTVILDDPSQSLDVQSKTNLCAVITDVSRSRQIILATADEELRNEVRNITTVKDLYSFDGWDPQHGPSVHADVEATHEV